MLCGVVSGCGLSIPMKVDGVELKVYFAAGVSLLDIREAY